MSEDIYTIVSPLSGTMYRRPSPDEPCFAEEGDEVKEGDVVCIVESMKVFNDIRAEYPGTIKKFLAENEDALMIHQPLVEVIKK